MITYWSNTPTGACRAVASRPSGSVDEVISYLHMNEGAHQPRCRCSWLKGTFEGTRNPLTCTDIWGVRPWCFLMFPVRCPLHQSIEIRRASPWPDTSDLRLVCSSYSTKRTSKKTRPLCHKSTTSTVLSLVSSCVVSVQPLDLSEFPCTCLNDWHFDILSILVKEEYTDESIHRYVSWFVPKESYWYVSMPSWTYCSLSALQVSCSQLCSTFWKSVFFVLKMAIQMAIILFRVQSGVLDVLVDYCCFTELPEASDVRYRFDVSLRKAWSVLIQNSCEA